MEKDNEKVVTPLVVNEFRSLIEGYVEIEARLKLAYLTDEERSMLQLKLVTIEGISLILKLIEDSSERNKVLLTLCLSGEKCSMKYLIKGIKSQAALRDTRNQFRFLLASTLFKSDKVEALLLSESLQKVVEVVKWYNTVFDNAELKRYYLNSLKGGNQHEAQT